MYRKSDYPNYVFDTEEYRDLNIYQILERLERSEQENQHLKNVINLMEYQLKVQDRIIEEYEEMQ